MRGVAANRLGDWRRRNWQENLAASKNPYDRSRGIAVVENKDRYFGFGSMASGDERLVLGSEISITAYRQ